jgi:hypothetical protein
MFRAPTRCGRTRDQHPPVSSCPPYFLVPSYQLTLCSQEMLCSEEHTRIQSLCKAISNCRWKLTFLGLCLLVERMVISVTETREGCINNTGWVQ